MNDDITDTITAAAFNQRTRENLAALTAPIARNCGSCRHWRRDPTPSPTGTCELTRTTVAQPFGEVDSLAVAQAGRATTAVLLTRGDFSCVQWADLTAADIERIAPVASAFKRMEDLLDG